jgi:hypothetical protein
VIASAMASIVRRLAAAAVLALASAGTPAQAGNPPQLIVDGTVHFVPGESSPGTCRVLVHSSTIALSAFAGVVACLTGLAALWAGKPFGTPADYLLAFLRGFGIDGSIRGFSAVASRLRGAAST